MRWNQLAGHNTTPAAGRIPPASTPSSAQGWDGALSRTTEYSTTMWQDSFARTGFSLKSKIHGPLGHRRSGHRVKMEAGHSSRVTHDTSTKSDCLTSQSSTPTLRTQHVRLENTWPMQSSGRKSSIESRYSLPFSLLSLAVSTRGDPRPHHLRVPFRLVKKSGGGDGNSVS